MAVMGEPSVEDAETLAASLTPNRVVASRPRRDTAASADARYDLGPVLGRGGMGEVRLAHDVRIDRDVAVKLMHPQQRDDATIARFFREARVQGQLEHPAVVPVHDLGIDVDGNPYFVMKRVTGTTLAEVLAQAAAAGAEPDADHAIASSSTSLPAAGTRWPRRALLARFVDVCLAVEFAHTRGVVHRDLKPANIMLGDFGEVHVIDWGLARIRDDATRAVQIAPLPGDVGSGDGDTVAGSLLGTPGYMSPEQARGEPVDARADVYALGCILYELVAGAPALPRGIAGIEATLAAASLRPSTTHPDAAIPPELDDACATATAADRADRPTARGLAEQVQAYLDGDRDLERRRELAASHVTAARAALREPGDDARARAMRDAGRALALDPGNAAAADLAARLLLDAPAAIPAEALAAADLARARVRRSLMGWIAVAYLFIAALISTLYVFHVRHYAPIALMQGLVLANAVVAVFAARRLLPMKARLFHVITWLNAGALACACACFGPMLVVPVFVIGSLSSGLSQPTRLSALAIVLPLILAVFVPLMLELTGVTHASFVFTDDGGLVFTPWAIEMPPTAMIFVIFAAILSQVVITTGLTLRQRDAQQAAENRLHATTWHLEQLLPRPTEARPDAKSL